MFSARFTPEKYENARILNLRLWKIRSAKSHHCNRDAIVLEKLTYLQKAGLENVFENDSK